MFLIYMYAKSTEWEWGDELSEVPIISEDQYIIIIITIGYNKYIRKTRLNFSLKSFFANDKKCFTTSH